jgi:hypothetical protein
MSVTDELAREIGQAFAATCRALQAREITVEQARARNRALRVTHGDEAYEAGKNLAVAVMARTDLANGS